MVCSDGCCHTCDQINDEHKKKAFTSETNHLNGLLYEPSSGMVANSGFYVLNAEGKVECCAKDETSSEELTHYSRECEFSTEANTGDDSVAKNRAGNCNRTDVLLVSEHVSTETFVNEELPGKIPSKTSIFKANTVQANDDQGNKSSKNTDDDQASSSHDSDLNHDLGETSFSRAMFIAYSEMTVHPGNISMRSDGSISSSSFAFPILQSEWSSSPVKMAKVHSRKHKGRRSNLFCCRF